MQGFERIEIMGNVGKAAEMRYTPTGVPVTSFSVAVNKKWTDANGQAHEKTKWYRVTCWRKLAEITAQYVKKGMGVFVEGEIDASSFTDREGNNRASLELTATNVKFLSGGSDADGESGGSYSSGGSSGGAGSYEPPQEDDLPF